MEARAAKTKHDSRESQAVPTVYIVPSALSLSQDARLPGLRPQPASLPHTALLFDGGKNLNHIAVVRTQPVHGSKYSGYKSSSTLKGAVFKPLLIRREKKRID